MRQGLFFLTLLALLSGVVAAQETVTPINSDERLLVWTAAALAPDAINPAEAGQLAFFTPDGVLTPLIDVPAPTTRVTACGDDAQSADGRSFAFYMGADTGTLYLMNNAGMPQAIDSVSYLTCLGMGTFRFAPSALRFAYIAFDERDTRQVFAAGFLKVIDPATGNELYTRENVTAFDLNDEGAAYVSFFLNEQEQADEAAVIWWDGTSEREVATLLPQTDCQFTSAAVGIAPDGNFVLVLGQRCPGDAGTAWQVYAVDRESRSATFASSDVQVGAFTAFARTNNVWYAPDGSVVYFTVPDGLVANTVGLRAASRAAFDITSVLDEFAIFPTFSGTDNAAPDFSPDGTWLATVVTSRNNDNSLHAFDLRDPTIPPIVINAGSRGDIIAALDFTRDSQQMIFVAGGANGANNSLFALDLTTGGEQRVTRGRFADWLALSPDGVRAALLDWQIIEGESDPAYVNLVVVDTAAGTTTTLLEGAEVVDGDATALQFAAPVAWLRAE